MATKNDFMVIVTARPNADLDILMGYGSPLSVPCGTMGTSIARRVLEGKGQAVISAQDLLPTFDTSDGVNVMLDNFDFTVKSTLRPLLFELLRLHGS